MVKTKKLAENYISNKLKNESVKYCIEGYLVLLIKIKKKLSCSRFEKR